jgi:hypothetical protein
MHGLAWEAYGHAMPIGGGMPCYAMQGGGGMQGGYAGMATRSARSMAY